MTYLVSAVQTGIVGGMGLPAVVRQLERLRRTYGLNKTDMGRLVNPQRNNGSASVYWDPIYTGVNRVVLNDADTLAREMGGRLTVTHRNPWANVLLAIEDIPDDEIEAATRDDLLTLLGRAYWRKHPEGPIPRDLQLRPSRKVIQLLAKAKDA